MNRANVPILATLVLLCGCGTMLTDRAALTYANQTVKLLGEAEKDAQAFLAVMDRAEAARVAAMAMQKDRIRKIVASQDVRYRARESAGDGTTTAVRNQLLADADHVAKLYATPAGPTDSYEATVKALLQPLPNPSPALTEAQAKAAAMGQELSPEMRRNETLAFFDAVAKSIKDNRKLIKDAEVQAAATAASAAMTTPK
jgi:hypothetical protein